MDIAEVRQPASLWEHYIAAPDGLDEEGRAFDNKVHRVLSELWVSLHGTTFTNTSYSLHIFEIMTLFSFCAEFLQMRGGNDARGMQVATKACYKLVADMLYEARIQAVIDYKAKIEKVRIYKGPARDIRHTREQYLRVNTQSYLNQLCSICSSYMS